MTKTPCITCVHAQFPDPDSAYGQCAFVPLVAPRSLRSLDIRREDGTRDRDAECAAWKKGKV